MDLFSLKILPMPPETPVKTGRRVPEISLAGIDFIRDLERFFLGCGSLKGSEAKKAAAEIARQFRLDFNSSATVIDAFFSQRSTASALNKPQVRHGLIAIAEQMIGKGKYYEAKTLVTRLLEYIPRDQVEIQLGLFFLRARAENQLANRLAAYQNIIQKIPFLRADPFLGLYCHYQIVMTLIQAGEHAKAEAALGSFVDDKFSNVFRSLLAGDLKVVKGEEGEALRHYSAARAALYECSPDGSERYSYPRHRSAIIEKLKKIGIFSFEPSALDMLHKVRSSSRPQEAGALVTQWMFGEFYANLHLALLLKEANLLKKRGDLKTAAVRLETADSIMREKFSLFSEARGEQAVWLTLGEHAYAQGRMPEAVKAFENAGRHNFHALTRLNEIELEAVAAEDRPPETARARSLVGQLDAEIRMRREAYQDEAREEITGLLLQKLTLAQKAHFVEACREALKLLVETVKGTQFETMVLIYAASQPYCDEETKSRAKRTAFVPTQAEIKTPIQGEIATTLFGTEDFDVLSEMAYQMKRSLMREKKSTPEEALRVPPQLAPATALLSAYETNSPRLQQKMLGIFDAARRKERPLFFGEVMSPYRLLSECGIFSFEFTLNSDKTSVTLRINMHDGRYLEMPFDENFNFSGFKSVAIDRLITLIAKDFFLAVQLGDAHQSVFEKVEFQFYSESEFLNELRLKSRLGSLVSRPATPTEETLAELETEAAELAAPPAEKEKKETSLDEKKQIFQHKSFRDLLSAQQITIDIPKLASLLPLAQLLSRMEARADGERAALALFFGDKQILIEIDPAGNIRIADQNRGVTNLTLIRRMNEFILDVLNAHFIPDYEKALGSQEPDHHIHQVYRLIQETAGARAKKWEVYQELRPEERTFNIARVAGQPHPFESIFFEVKEGEGIPSLKPLPNMKYLAEANRAVVAGRKIVQVGIVGIHPRKISTPILSARLDYYILRFVLGKKVGLREVGAIEDADRRQVENIKARILAGEATVDPNGFLRRDPENHEAVTMDEIMAISSGNKQEVLRVHQSFVRPFLRVYEMQPLSPEEAERLDKALRITLKSGVPIKKEPVRPEPARPAQPAPVRTEEKAPREKPAATREKTQVTRPAQPVKKSTLEEAKVTAITKAMLKDLKDKFGLDLSAIEEQTGLSSFELFNIQTGKRSSSEHIFGRLRILMIKMVAKYGKKKDNSDK